jgi:subtilisin family serine protease
MKQRTIFISAFIILCLVITTDAFCQQKAPAPEKNYVAGEVLVRFHDWVGETEKASVRSDLGATVDKKIESIGVEKWSLPEGLSVSRAIETLEKLNSVDYAEPNYLYQPQALPNDEGFELLWHLKNTGQMLWGLIGTRGADISAEQAWNIETGDPSIIIAVIDSGVAYDHPDLLDNIWTNSDEIPGNQFDDDGNGYIDDRNGWDFVNEDNLPLDYSRDLYSDGHGTHVAGIIASKGNNTIGTTGVMWNAQIMPLKIFDLFQVGTFQIQLSRIVEAIEYAVNNGAQIINCSLGGPIDSPSMHRAILYAHNHGVLLIAAAGNDYNVNIDLRPTYPAAYELPNIVSVAATNQNDKLSLYSNYGAQSVDVAAPGGSAVEPNFLSTSPPERIPLFREDFDVNRNLWTTGGTGLNGYYKEWSIVFDPVFGSNVLIDSVGNYWNFEDKFIRTVHRINTWNCRGLHIQYKVDYSLEYDRDYLYFEFSPDGVNYYKINPLSCTGISSGIELRKDWADDIGIDGFYLGFRLFANSKTNFDGVYIDDIVVTGVPWEYDGSEYSFKKGTSMAAPVVSGIAGLIWSHNPSLSHIEVKDIIMNSVDQIAGLRNKVMSGGRVNAHRALLMAGGSETTLYFPHIASNNAWETEVCVINKSNEGLSGALKSFDADGNKLGEKNLSLNGRGRRAIVVGDEFSSAKNIRYITLSADVPDICGYTKFYHEGLYRVAVPAVKDVNRGDIYIPHIASDDKWWTGLALVNTTNSAKNLEITFNNNSTRGISLPPGAHRGFSIKSLFGNIPQVAIESAVITGGEGVIGLELFAGGKVLTGVPLIDDSTNTLFFPHVASDKKWWTGIAAYNSNQAGATLSVTPYTQAGAALDMISVDIPAGGKYLGNAKTLNLPSKTAWFKVNSSKPLNGFELFGTRNGNSLAGYSAVDIKIREGVFPKLDHVGWTGIAFVNTSNGSADIALRMYDDDGFVISEKSIDLDGYEKMVGNPEDIFSGPITAGTYLGFVSDKDVVGFQLNGSKDGMMLDGLPGM